MRSMRHILWMGWLMLWAAAAVSAPTASAPEDLLEQSRSLRRQMRVQTASAVAERTAQQEDASLAQLIEQVRSLRAPAGADPNHATLSERAAGRDAGFSAAAPAAKTPSMPAAVQEQPEIELAELLEGQTYVPYPTQLADTLYRKGMIEAAARYYETALKTVDKEDIAMHQWLLFQAANCLRHSDGTRAAALYEDLIRLYPNSVWAAAAQARHSLLFWMDTRREDVELRLAQRDEDD